MSKNIDGAVLLSRVTVTNDHDEQEYDILLRCLVEGGKHFFHQGTEKGLDVGVLMSCWKETVLKHAVVKAGIENSLMPRNKDIPALKRQFHT